MSPAPAAEAPDRAWPCAHLAVDEPNRHPWCHRYHERHPDRGDCRTCPDYAAPGYLLMRAEVWVGLMGRTAPGAASTCAAGDDLANIRAALHRNAGEARHIIRVDRDYDHREAARVRLWLLRRMEEDLDAIADYICGNIGQGGSGG